jgi:4-diphosphocytidyl-2-C-methyl-D-erythritol kinase
MRLIPRRRSQRQSRAAARGSTSALMRWFRAPAKINLTLRVIGRRTDGYHDIESLVAFAGICDWLGYEPGYGLELDVCGPRAPEAGAVSENLVLRAATALAHRVPRLTLGRFHLFKRLPAAAGLGGGSSDAAAAFRALADANGLRIEDERLRAAALDTGADVPVCLAPRSRVMSGIGDRLGPLIRLPRMFAVLVNPGVATPTRQVFAALRLPSGSMDKLSNPAFAAPDPNAPLTFDALVSGRNDLEDGALRVAPAIAEALEMLSRVPQAKLIRMSGSGATCYALFDNRRSAATARFRISADRPGWWVKATVLR